jgi:hypothetical protein
LRIREGKSHFLKQIWTVKIGRQMTFKMGRIWARIWLKTDDFVLWKPDNFVLWKPNDFVRIWLGKAEKLWKQVLPLKLVEMTQQSAVDSTFDFESEFD